MDDKRIVHSEEERPEPPDRSDSPAPSAAGGGGLSRARIEEILERRAERLALEEADLTREADGLPMLELLLAGERYGLDALSVQEVLPRRDITPIPQTPPFVAGIINLRGRIVSVIDIRKILDLPGGDATARSRVIVLSDGGRSLGMLADAVAGVRRFGMDRVLAPPPLPGGIGGEFITGVLEDGLIILDVRRILADRRIIVDSGREK